MGITPSLALKKYFMKKVTKFNVNEHCNGFIEGGIEAGRGNCSTYSRYVVTSSSTSISCGSTNSGEVDTTPYPILLVGGCYSYSSAETFYRIYPSGNTFYCYKAGSTASIRAYAKCCRLD
jgi:hypothetical protein